MHQLCDFRCCQVECGQVFHYSGLFNRGQRQLVVACHDASDALNVIAGEGNNLDALNGLSCLAAAQICAVATMSPRYALLWTTAIFTGLRHGELTALAWEDVDLDKGELHVRRNQTNEGLFVPPKTEAGIRTVTLLEPALNALREQFKLTGALSKTEITFHHREHGLTEQQKLRFVFIPPKNWRGETKYYGSQSLGYSWEAGLKKAGIRSRRPYQSRHTFACWLLTAGANPSFIAGQMGHENAKMVYEIYSKWIGEMDRNQVEMLNSSFSNALSQGCPKRKVVGIKSV